MHIVHTESSLGWGGQEIRILTEAAGMIRRGHAVTLLCPGESSIFRAAAGYDVPTIALPIAYKRPGSLWALRRWLGRHADTIDLINTHSSTDAWLTAIACVMLKDAPPLLRTRHVSSPINARATTFWLYQRAMRHIVVTGEPLRQQLVRDNGFVADCITSVPTGIDLERYRPRPQSECRRTLGLAGGVLIGILATLRDWKGHLYLFEAVSQLLPRYPGLRLLVIGDGPFRWRLEQRVAELGMAQAVHFVGQQENAETWLGALDLFVLPSYGDEGVSQALMQAMATGLPVITTSVGGLSELVTDNETGLIVPTRDSSALAAAISRLLDDAVLRKFLAMAGCDFARARCGLDLMLNRMEEIFHRYARTRSQTVAPTVSRHTGG